MPNLTRFTLLMLAAPSEYEPVRAADVSVAPAQRAVISRRPAAFNAPPRADCFALARPSPQEPEEILIAGSQAPRSDATTSPGNKTILAKLEMAVPMKYPTATPLERVVSDIAKATIGPDDRRMPIYVDPIGLLSVDRRLTSPVTMDVEGVPLKNTLRRLLAPLELDYCVYDGVLVISQRDFIDDYFTKVPVFARDRSQRTVAILKKLAQPIPLKYPGLTPLEQVLSDVAKATKSSNDSGMPIYVDPVGMILAEKTMGSPVMSGPDGIPLRTTLHLLLTQLGLGYCVEDGLLIVSEPDLIDEEPETAPVIARDRSRATLDVLAKLAQPIAMKYPDLSPLERVVSDLAKATKGPRVRGIPIDIDPAGL